MAKSSPAARKHLRRPSIPRERSLRKRVGRLPPGGSMKRCETCHADRTPIMLAQSLTRCPLLRPRRRISPSRIRSRSGSSLRRGDSLLSYLRRAFVNRSDTHGNTQTMREPGTVAKVQSPAGGGSRTHRRACCFSCDVPKPESGIMAAIPPFTDPQLEQLCAVVADTSDGLTGSEIGRFLAECRIADPHPAVTKRHRLFTVLQHRQIQDGCSNHVFAFLQRALDPVRYSLRDRTAFDNRRAEVNVVLRFCGYELGEDGKFRRNDGNENVDRSGGACRSALEASSAAATFMPTFSRSVERNSCSRTTSTPCSKQQRA